jgi:hypothetical protein
MFKRLIQTAIEAIVKAVIDSAIDHIEKKKQPPKS